MTGKTIDEIAASFQSGFTNGNALWDETPEHHKDMFRDGVRCAMAALSSVPAIEGGEVKPTAWLVETFDDAGKDCLNSQFVSLPSHVALFNKPYHRVTPLFASPPPSSEASPAMAPDSEDGISQIAIHLDCEHDADSILHIIREIQADLEIAREAAIPSSSVEGLRAALANIRDKAAQGTAHGLSADLICEEIASIARAALSSNHGRAA